MTYLRFLASLSAWVIASNCLGYSLDATTIAKVLGYPRDQLVTTDVTEAERQLNAIPVEREKGGLRARIEPERILQAVRITSRIKQSFYPILVTVAKKGTFLSPQFMNLVEKLNAIPATDRKKQGMGHLGRFKIEGLGEGGCAIADIRIPSSIKEISEPSFGAVTLTELRLEQEGVDIRVAMFLTLEEGGAAPLLKVDGGDIYYASFKSTGGDFQDSDPANVVESFDWSRGLTVLNLEARRALKSASLLTKVSSNEAPRTNESRTMTERDSTPLVTVVVLIVAACGLLWLVLKRRS